MRGSAESRLARLQPQTNEKRRRQLRCPALVRAAFFAAGERPFALFVRDALRAAVERDDALRRAAARFACCEGARWDAALRGSFFRTCFTARETRGLRVFSVCPDLLRRHTRRCGGCFL